MIVYIVTLGVATMKYLFDCSTTIFVADGSLQSPKCPYTHPLQPHRSS